MLLIVKPENTIFLYNFHRIIWGTIIYVWKHISSHTKNSENYKLECAF